ncbi:hypothetical protein [Ruminococcus difficilis]|uniref:Uncharacterized protein n=1 Tax=Ruminococcus difficilis TaxID=2763069 RepID=A0A934WTH5_9FIRM|nr:hypothetical protein [Ruminococcus difficilis]MBK6089634.1 hypothetical protein [Ruminococcus difficilis]
MISVFDVLTWLKRAPVYHELFRRGYCGKLDNKPDKAMGVYPLKRSGRPYRAYGGLESYEIIGISLLIHYTHNMEQSQFAAEKIFEFLRTPLPSDLSRITDRRPDAEYPDEEVPACPVHYPDIDSEATRRIKFIDLTVPEPVFFGTDDYGVFEFVIEFELYVEKENENNA